MRTAASRVGALRRRCASVLLALAAVGGVAGCGGGGGADGAASKSAGSAASADTSPGEAGVSTGAAVSAGTSQLSPPSAVASTLGAASGSPVATPASFGCEPPGVAGWTPPGPGLREVCRDLWLDAGYPVAEEAAIVAALEGAGRRILEVFDWPVNGLPVVVVCRTDGCIRRFTGSDGRNMTLYPGARAPDGEFVAGPRTVTIVTAPGVSWLEQILAHEFSHHELYGRLAGRLERVPPWFNEGLATLVGRVPSCVPMPASPVGIGSLVDQFQWNVYTAAHPDIALAVYCSAARELDGWLAVNGRAELLRLIGDVAAGARFAERYGPMYLERAPAQLVRAL